MNIKKVSAVILGALILFGVSYMVFGAGGETIKNNYTFVGSSDHWEASYKVNAKEKFYERNGRGQYDSAYEDQFKLTFNGTDKELAEIEEFYYKYQSPAGSSDSTMTFEEPRTSKVFSSGAFHQGSAIPRENHIIEVIVRWDGNEENFELKVQE